MAAHAQRPQPPTLGTLLSLFERMLAMRRFEEAVMALSREGHPFGHFHVYVGQEAAGSGVIEALEESDLTLTTHRNHGHVIGRGSAPGPMLAEILGRAGGLCGGRAGTIHLCDRSRGFLQTSAVVGGVLALAIGAAFQLKNEGKGRVAVAFFGDGALEEGVAFEALNFAALWRLPVLFVCENNSLGAIGQKGGGYPTAITAATSFTGIPETFGIATARVGPEDGVVGVLDAARSALAACRAGGGPRFLETVTARWPGSQGLWPEPATGVTDLRQAWGDAPIEGAHAAWIDRHDPIIRLARDMIAAGVDRGTLLEVDRKVAEQMAEARRFALASPWPDPATAGQRVFADDGVAA